MDERKITIAAAVFAVAGIALLILLSEAARDASVAEALVAPENSLLRISGEAANATADKFYICQRSLCISVRKGGLASAELVADGTEVSALGRVKEYKGSRYFVAEKIEVNSG